MPNIPSLKDGSISLFSDKKVFSKESITQPPEYCKPSLQLQLMNEELVGLFTKYPSLKKEERGKITTATISMFNSFSFWPTKFTEGQKEMFRNFFCNTTAGTIEYDCLKIKKLVLVYCENMGINEASKNDIITKLQNVYRDARQTDGRQQTMWATMRLVAELVKTVLEQ